MDLLFFFSSVCINPNPPPEFTDKLFALFSLFLTLKLSFYCVKKFIFVSCAMFLKFIFLRGVLSDNGIINYYGIYFSVAYK
jgi:hypothetical protein